MTCARSSRDVMSSGEDRILFFGRSIGGAVAIKLAAHTLLGAVMLLVFGGPHFPEPGCGCEMLRILQGDALLFFLCGVA